MQLIDRFYWKAVWILTGICCAVAGSLMLISGSFNLDCFYDVGEVYDVPRMTLEQNSDNSVYYDPIKKIWSVTTETAVKPITISPGNWKYFYLHLSEVSQDSFATELVCYNVLGEPVCQMDAILSEGENLFVLPDVEYTRLNIIILNQTGLSFCMKKMQFRETPPIFSRTLFLRGFIAVFFMYFLITGCIYFFVRKRIRRFSCYAPIHALQELFLYLGKGGEGFGRYSPRKRGLIRSGLFCFLFLFMQVNFILGFYHSNEWYRFLVLVCLAVVVLIAYLCWERPLVYLNWDNKLVLSWMMLWIVTIISDFIAQKRYAYTGYVMIFGMGFLFFMWGNMEHREQLLLDFIRGIKWSFFPNFLFCILFRPYITGYRYNGSSHSPGYFALYLLFVWLAFFGDIAFDTDNKKSVRNDLVSVFVLGICGDLLWKTQSISSILPAALAVLVFSFKLWLKRRQMKVLLLAAYLILFCFGHISADRGVYHIPRWINAEIKFEGDTYLDTVTEHPFTLNVQASEQPTVNRILYKLQTFTGLESLTTGRTLFWKAHLRKLNLWGHRRSAYFLGSYRLPHSGFISMLYWYGIFAVIPYLLMLLYSFLYTCRYVRRHLFEHKYAFFVLADMLSCYLLLLVENLERPFVLVCWYSLYVVMGVFFDDEK